MPFTISISGDLAQVKSLAKQIVYAAKQTVISLAQEAQPEVITTIRSTFVVRRAWYEPGNRFGIHIRFSRDRDDLTSRLETAADWLEEHETGETRTPDTEGHHGSDPHLTYPHAARPNLSDIVATDAKAWRILPNVSELLTHKGFRTAGRPSKSKGKRGPTFNEVSFFVNRKGTAIFERLPGDRLKLFYTLPKQVHIKRQSTVVEPTATVVRERAGDIFNDKLIAAVSTAK
jgi:hypothetical protein